MLDRIGQGTVWTPVSDLVTDVLNGSPPVTAIASATYTISDADFGTILDFTSSTSVAVTLPASLPPGFLCYIFQGGLGQVTVTAGGGVTLVNIDSQSATQARYARLVIWQLASDAYVLEGRTA